MRTIKFRAWSEECYDEENDSYVFEMISADRLAISEYNLLKDQLKQTEKFRLMQFTGLQDKNGKEIYEGDIVVYDRGVGNWTGKRMSTTHTIVFSEEVFAFVMDYGSSYIKLRKHWNYIYEVIGNIYENPELLSTPTAVL